MKFIKIAGLSLVAMLVMSMAAAGSASAALPEFVQCREVAAKAGHWSNEQCTVVQKEGNWETRAGGSVGGETFSATSGEGKLETTGGKKVECTSDRANGRIVGVKEVSGVSITFFGCKEPKIVAKCNTTGSKEGEITTNLVKGKIGYIEMATQKVGMLLEPEGTKFVEFECTATTKIKVEGSVIGEVSPVNVMGRVGELSYKQTTGVQAITKFEGESGEHSLESTFTGGTKEKSAIETSKHPDQIEFNHDTEIRG